MTAPTPSAEELDALEKRLREAGSRSDPETVEALGSDWQSIEHDAADVIKALRQQVLALQQEVTRQTALKNQAMRLNEENPCGG